MKNPVMMLAVDYERSSHKVDWNTAFAQPCIAGIHCLVRVSLGSRTKIVPPDGWSLAGLSDMRSAIDAVSDSAIGDLDEFVLDGYLYGPELTPAGLQIGCSRRSKFTSLVKLYLYDAVAEDDFKIRFGIVRTFFDAAIATGFVQIAEPIKVRSESDIMLCQQKFISEGADGVLLRYGHEPYKPGRSEKLLKACTFVEEQFEVVDWKIDHKPTACVVFTCVTQKKNQFDVVAPGADVRTASKMVGKRINVKFHQMSKTRDPVPLLPVAVP